MTTTIVRCVIGALALSNAAFASPLSTSPFPPDTQKTMPLAPIVSSSPAFINNSYIVVLKDGISPAALYQHSLFVQDAHDADPLAAEDSGLRHVYDGKLKGYAGHFTEQTIEKIRAQPEVDYIERDQVVWALETQRGAPWGLARISHRPRLTFGTFTKYEYDSTAGQGVDVYVIDTGIFVDHEQFEGRAKWGKTIPKDASDSDGNGHGTHCAGTIASKKYGVAKAANVIAVKVLGDNGSGSMSDVVSGVLWAAEQAAAKAKVAAAEFARTGVAPAHKGSVASMSLGGGKSRALDDMVNKAVDSGLHFAVAAGNDNRDACDYSPAAAEKAITVGASTLGDERAYFSNHGPCVDVFAPGLNILSTWIGHKDATNTISGTSMATPHTAGLLAYLISIYPSKSFDPKVEESFDPAAAAAFLSAVGTTTNPAFSSILNIAHATLPNWVTSYLPSLPVVNDDAAPKLPTLTPAQLKKAILALSTPDALSELPAKTVNKLIFNNATSLNSAEAWAKVLEA